ncbi:uncharacterized protein FMAN_09328 [Fusarium mangiferae]|uniref:Uncharacterized protein n=1 Tax=Fusarium mangiferae TaxID=192010 RepID=A0A1L7T3A1_FUSMA|nr:uncharacterized protein FMAN_09328 [Fusarium mangiferae]CVK91182.1 uncharacterized protein FMAN_09328 [Fusarium mangiferae]
MTIIWTFGTLLKDSTSLNTAGSCSRRLLFAMLCSGATTSDSHIFEIMNAQAKAYFPEALYLYSHFVPQLPIDDNQDINASSEESGYDAKSVNQESPGVCSLDNGLGR